MPEEFANSLRFSLEEQVNFEPQCCVQEICSISLEPNVTCHSFDEYLILRGTLALYGTYVPCEFEAEVGASDFYTVQNCARVAPCEDDPDCCEFSYQFPVDITIPAERVRSEDELTIGVESFDCQITDNGCLTVSAELCINGVYEREYLAQERAQAVQDYHEQAYQAYQEQDQAQQQQAYQVQDQEEYQFEEQAYQQQNQQEYQPQQQAYQQQNRQPQDQPQQQAYSAQDQQQPAQAQQQSDQSQYQRPPAQSQQQFNQSQYHQPPVQAQQQGYQAQNQQQQQPPSQQQAFQQQSEQQDQQSQWQQAYQQQPQWQEEEEDEVAYARGGVAETEVEEQQAYYQDEQDDSYEQAWQSPPQQSPYQGQYHPYEHASSYQIEEAYEEQEEQPQAEQPSFQQEADYSEPATLERPEVYDKVIFPFDIEDEAPEDADFYVEVTKQQQAVIEEFPEVTQAKLAKSSQHQTHQQHRVSRLDQILSSRNESNTCLKVYIVQQGDSLEKLAVRYATPANKIARHNQLQPNARIEEGTILYIPN